MSRRVEVLEAQPIEFPLRALVVTLLLGLHHETELMSEEEVDQGPHGDAIRDPFEIAGNLEEWDITVNNVTVAIEDTRDNVSVVETYLFTRGDEAMIVDYDQPEYRDDDADGYITGVSKLMTVAEARTTLSKRLSAYQASIEKHVAKRSAEFEAMFAELKGEVAA